MAKIPKQTLDNIRDKLPYGCYKDIAEYADVTEHYVSLVLNGHRNNSLVIEKALQIIKQCKEDEVKEVTRINEILDNVK